MPMTLEQIEHEVDQLPNNQLDKLAEYIFQRKELSEHDRIWGEECERRYQAYLEGRTTARPAKDVLKDLMAKYQ